MLNLRPNPWLHPTCYSGVRPLPRAAERRRYGHRHPWWRFGHIVPMGGLFRHVVLRGWFGGVLFRWQVDVDDKVFSRRFLTANLTAYASMDWALDISEASFSIYQSLLGVPAALVRRNPAKHFVLHRDAAAKVVAQANAPSLWRITAEELIESGLSDTVVATGGAGKSLKAQLADAESLRDQGLLE